MKLLMNQVSGSFFAVLFLPTLALADAQPLAAGTQLAKINLGSTPSMTIRFQDHLGDIEHKADGGYRWGGFFAGGIPVQAPITFAAALEEHGFKNERARVCHVDIMANRPPDEALIDQDFPVIALEFNDSPWMDIPGQPANLQEVYVRFSANSDGSGWRGSLICKRKGFARGDEQSYGKSLASQAWFVDEIANSFGNAPSGIPLIEFRGMDSER